MAFLLIQKRRGCRDVPQELLQGSWKPRSFTRCQAPCLINSNQRRLTGDSLPLRKRRFVDVALMEAENQRSRYRR